MEDVLLALDIHTKIHGGGLMFGTWTIPHEQGQSLADVMGMLQEGLTYVTRQRDFKEWRKGVGLVGNITALEVTCGCNGWHPHKHIMYLTDRQLSQDEVDSAEGMMLALYNRFLAKKGWKVSKEHVGVRLDYVEDPDDAEVIGKYLSKLQAGFELARGDLKQSRAAEGKGQMPFDILEDAIAGDEAAKRKWGEYERAMTGKSAVRFSKGLRSHLGMDAALTDEELAEQEVGGEPMMLITGKLYRKLFWDGQVVMMMRWAERDGVVGVLRGVRRLYGDQIWTSEGLAGLRVGIGKGGP